MANFLTKAFKKAGTWIDEKIGKPITEGVKTIKRTAGLEQTPLPAEATPQLDPRKIEALSDYGSRVREDLAATPRPMAYRPGEYSPRQTTPATMPGTRIRGHDIQVPSSDDRYIPMERVAPSPNTWRQQFTRESDIGGPAMAMQGTGVPNLQRVSQELSLGRTNTGPGAKFIREGQMEAPQLQMEGDQRAQQQRREAENRLVLEREGGNVLRLGRQGRDVSLGREGSIQLQNEPYTSAVQTALQESMGPMSLTEGYDPAMRAKAVQLATSGIDRQKERALAKLKEDQMASGNFGSSKGQQQMAELAMQYDEQRANAESQIDLQQMEAARQDRYSNISAQNARLGQISGIAGQGQNMELSGAQFGRQGIAADTNAQIMEENLRRQGVSADNASAIAEAQFGREGRSTDRSSTMMEAQFGREGRNIDAQAAQIQQEYARQGRQIDNATAMQLAQYGQQARGTDYARDMDQSRFAREGEQLNREATLQEAQFGQGATALNNQMEQIKAEYARQGIQLDNQTLMQLAQYGREGRATDFSRGTSEDQRSFQNQMEKSEFERRGRQSDFENQESMRHSDLQDQIAAGTFNMQNQGQMSNEEWRQYQERQRQIERGDTESNEAQIYNLENQSRANEVGYNRYQDALRNLAGYAGGSMYTPESERQSGIWQQQEAARQARLGTIFNTGAAIYGASQGRPPLGSVSQPAAPQTSPEQYQLQLRGTTPTYHGSRALVANRSTPNYGASQDSRGPAANRLADVQTVQAQPPLRPSFDQERGRPIGGGEAAQSRDAFYKTLQAQHQSRPPLDRGRGRPIGGTPALSRALASYRRAA